MHNNSWRNVGTLAGMVIRNLSKTKKHINLFGIRLLSVSVLTKNQKSYAYSSSFTRRSTP